MCQRPLLSFVFQPPRIDLGLADEYAGVEGPFRHRQRGAAAELVHVDPDHLDVQQHRSGIVGPDRAQAGPGLADVAAIKIKVDQ